MTYKITPGDNNVISNLRAEYADKLVSFTDTVVAQAWREFSLSDEYFRHKDEPHLFREWCEMEWQQ